MKVVAAIDSFKGSMTSLEVAAAFEKGVKKVYKDAEFIKIPLADGGEGTVKALIDNLDGKMVNIKVKDPLMRDIDSFYGISGDGKTAVIEMEAADGDAGKIKFVDMPEDLRGKYQYFTEAKIDKLKKAGYSRDFTSLEDGVKDYVQNYLMKEDKYL